MLKHFFFVTEMYRVTVVASALVALALAYPDPDSNAAPKVAENPVVTTPLGKYEGTVIQSRLGRQIKSFRGIRYAKPPINELRFQVS